MQRPQGVPSNPEFQTDIQKAQVAKLELQKSIEMLVREYEVTYGLTVTDINYTRVTAGGNLLSRKVEAVITI